MNADTTERDTQALNREGDQMNTETTKRDIAMLRSLARMPFLDRTELAATSGIAYRSAHYAVAALEERRLVEAVPHASRLIAPTHRFYVTPDGVLELARLDGVPPGDALTEYPISAHWQRIFLERLDAVAVIYRLASAVASVARPGGRHTPVGCLWYRSMPLDAALTLPDGRAIGVIRQGPTADRTAFGKRLWRLLDPPSQQASGPLPGALLLIVPDEVRLRHARRQLARAPIPVYLALEEDVAPANPYKPVWHLPNVATRLDLEEIMPYVEPVDFLPEEEPPAQALFPIEHDVDPPTDHLLPSLLKPGHKRVLDVLADWPWITSTDLLRLMCISRERISKLLQPLEQIGLVTTEPAGVRRRLALTDRGLALLARRDRSAVGTALKRWSVRRLDPDAPPTWRNVLGDRSRQLLRNVDHTDAVHTFISELSIHCDSEECRLLQIDPPRRAARYFNHQGTMRSVRPDAFGVVRKGDRTWPFFLEWERRAVLPSTMAARLAPYVRYYSTRRPMEDHGEMPVVLVVFDDMLAASRFLGVARAEMRRAGVEVPLLVSHRQAVVEHGPLERVWRAPRTMEPARPFLEN